MNAQFSNWTRQTAFVLTLNMEAITEIIFQARFNDDARRHGKDPADYGATYDGRQGLCSYLMRRGLLEQNQRGSYYLTNAGELTAKLLLEAGFSNARDTSSVFAAPLNTVR